MILHARIYLTIVNTGKLTLFLPFYNDCGNRTDTKRMSRGFLISRTGGLHWNTSCSQGGGIVHCYHSAPRYITS